MPKADRWGSFLTAVGVPTDAEVGHTADFDRSKVLNALQDSVQFQDIIPDGSLTLNECFGEEYLVGDRCVTHGCPPMTPFLMSTYDQKRKHPFVRGRNLNVYIRNALATLNVTHAIFQ